MSSPTGSKAELGRISVGAERKLSDFAVIGTDFVGIPDLIAHVALAMSTGSYKFGDEVEVLQMGPPLVSDSIPTTLDENRTTRLDVALDVPLTNDDLNSMNHWRAGIEMQKKAIDAVPGLSLIHI